MTDKANRLYADMTLKLAMWNERSMFTLKGVKNLSRADLDTIAMYARTIQTCGTYEGYLMPPRGGVEEVLKKYGLV